MISTYFNYVSVCFSVYVHASTCIYRGQKRVSDSPVARETGSQAVPGTELWPSEKNQQVLSMAKSSLQPYEAISEIEIEIQKTIGSPYPHIKEKSQN